MTKVKKEAEKSDDESEEDTYVNPHYKCSVKRDEIPEVPMNRFLMRGPSKLKTNKKKEQPEEEEDRQEEEEDIEAPFEVDLSKFEDIPDHEDIIDNNHPVTSATTAIKSRVKPTESVVSRSGRVMKGRGNFKFRTPSPETRRNKRHRYS